MVYGFHCDFFIILTLCSGKGTRFSINKRRESHLPPRAEGSFDSNVFIVLLTILVTSHPFLTSNNMLITSTTQITPTSIQCDNDQQPLESLPAPFIFAEVAILKFSAYVEVDTILSSNLHKPSQRPHSWVEGFHKNNCF